MKTEIENSSIHGTVINPGKVEVDEEIKNNIKNPAESKYRPYGKEEVPDVTDENKNKEENDEDEDSHQSLEDINNGLE